MDIVADATERKQMMAKKKGRYVIVRTYSAGCFAGNLVSRKGKEVPVWTR